MANEVWTIGRCLDWTRDYLGKKGDEHARYTAELLLTSVTGMKRIDLYMGLDKPMSPVELDRMHQAVVRRAKGEPVQYITGTTGFRTLEIKCAPGVLIPRPETEVLVGEVLDYLDRSVLGAGPASGRARVELPWNAQVEEARRAEEAAAAKRAEEEGTEAAGETALVAEDISADVSAESDAESGQSGAQDGPRVARVLEVGCGTGCIALSIAAEREGKVRCVSTDINPKAVELAIANRDALHMDEETVAFRLGDLVSPVRSDEAGAFDVLVSNPPYIPRKVMEVLPLEVTEYEPHLALEGGEDGLDIFRRLVAAAPRMLRPGGLLACELHEESLQDAAAICTAAGFKDVRIIEDLARRPRIILATVGEA